MPEESADALALALALAAAPVLDAPAKPVRTAVPDDSVVVALVEALVTGAVPNVVVLPYTEAALQYCSRCCWTVATPGSLGQLA